MDPWPQLNFLVGSGWQLPLLQLVLVLLRLGLGVIVVVLAWRRPPRWAAPALALAWLSVAGLWLVQAAHFNPLLANLFDEPDPRSYLALSRWLSPLAWGGAVLGGIALVALLRAIRPL